MGDVPDFRSSAEQTQSPNSVYNPNKPDYGYVERMAYEFINISGAVVKLYPKIADLTEGQDYQWDEDAHPIYGNGLEMKAYFKPEPKQIELIRYGVDVTMGVTSLVFHRGSLLAIPEIGDRLIAPGDVIRVPYNHVDERNEPLMMRVNNATPFGNFHYRWIYHQVTCEPILGDETLGPKVP